MRLDEIMPEYAFHEIHRKFVKVDPAGTIAAARDLKPAEISPLVGWMLALRHIPVYLTGKGGGGTLKGETFLSAVLEGGDMIDLGSTQDEILFGMIGQFWRLNEAGDVPIKSREAFLAFDEPGYAKVAANIAVRAEGEGTLLTTETRISVPDEATRKKFGFYWFFISAGSGWIRSLWLDAIRRRAERIHREG